MSVNLQFLQLIINIKCFVTNTLTLKVVGFPKAYRLWFTSCWSSLIQSKCWFQWLCLKFIFFAYEKKFSLSSKTCCKLYRAVFLSDCIAKSGLDWISLKNGSWIICELSCTVQELLVMSHSLVYINIMVILFLTWTNNEQYNFYSIF